MNGFRLIVLRSRVYLKYVLDFSPTEIRGILALMILLFLVDVYHVVDYRRSFSKEEEEILQSYVIEIEPGRQTQPMVPFMPDTVSIQMLRGWGWPDRLASNLAAYREKAGKFRTEKQIRSLYGMTDSIFEVVRPYLVIQEQKVKTFLKDTARRPAYRRCPDPMDLNMADSAMLTRLHGIGPVLSGRIIAYRELLGGFIEVNQLNEVYGLSKETRKHIREQLYIDSAFIPRRIPVVDGTYSELYRHPYLDSRQAVFLLRYRQQHGTQEMLEAIKSNPRFKKKDIERVLPYLQLPDSAGNPGQR